MDSSDFVLHACFLQNGAVPDHYLERDETLDIRHLQVD